MKICIDGSPVLAGYGGIHTYGSNLIRAMVNESVQDDFIVFLNVWRKESMKNIRVFQSPENGRKIQYKFAKVPRKLLSAIWLYFPLVSIENFAGKIDAFHSLHCILPAQKNGASVLTVHDMAYFKNPNFYRDKKLTRYDVGFLMQKSIPKASRLIAISENTKKDIHEILGVPLKKISVVYFGIDHGKYVKKSSHEIQQTIENFRVDTPYILAVVGTLEPRKNIPGLLRAFSLFKKRSRMPHSLVIIGAGPLHFIQREESLACGLDTNKDIVFLSNLTEDTLLRLYSGAEFFIYPSLYEGFGLPVLEAMCIGLPVACSSVSSLPEVAGDAGVYFNPYDVEEMAYALLLLAESAVLRKTLSEKSMQRAKQFSWEKAARETLKVYQEATA